jgi:hypothetical protein
MWRAGVLPVGVHEHDEYELRIEGQNPSLMACSKKEDEPGRQPMGGSTDWDKILKGNRLTFTGPQTRLV